MYTFHTVGPWRSWERASMASRRSGVRIPPAPPKLAQTLRELCRAVAAEGVWRRRAERSRLKKHNAGEVPIPESGTRFPRRGPAVVGHTPSTTESNPDALLPKFIFGSESPQRCACLSAFHRALPANTCASATHQAPLFAVGLAPKVHPCWPLCRSRQSTGPRKRLPESSLRAQ